MDKFEKEEMRQMMTDVLEVHAANVRAEFASVRGEFTVVNLKLEEIGRLGQRLTDLETKPHALETCPYGTDIKDLRDNMVTAKAERKFMLRAGSILAALVTITLTAIKLFILA